MLHFKSLVMKKMMLIALAAIAFTTATQAQDSTGRIKMNGDHAGKMQHAQMWDDLNLTQDQKDKMKKLREDNMSKMDAIKNNSSLTDDQKQEQMKTMREDQRKSMEAILTDEQKAKMKQMREDRMKEHKGMHSDSTMHR